MEVLDARRRLVRRLRAERDLKQAMIEQRLSSTSPLPSVIADLILRSLIFVSGRAKCKGLQDQIELYLDRESHMQQLYAQIQQKRYDMEKNVLRSPFPLMPVLFLILSNC